MSESDKWRPQLIAHRFAETASSQHWIGHRFLLRLIRHRDLSYGWQVFLQTLFGFTNHGKKAHRSYEPFIRRLEVRASG